MALRFFPGKELVHVLKTEDNCVINDNQELRFLGEMRECVVYCACKTVLISVLAESDGDASVCVFAVGTELIQKCVRS
jgi:hypothetical protein